MAMGPNPCVRVCVSVSRVPAGRMERESLPVTRRVGVAAPLSVFRPTACGLGPGTREEPGTFYTGFACFPWFLSFGNRTQNSRVAGARPNHQANRGSDPNHRGIWSPPMAGQSREALCSTNKLLTVRSP
jgi:hypothetical protein